MIGLKPASDYKWGHAINSQLLLDQTLKDASVNAIEADVIYSENQQQAVMGHPPQTDSALTLDSFLQQLLRSEFQSHQTQTIVKLDFKSQSAFDTSLDLVARYVEKTQFPVGLWINADVVRGPGGGASVFDAGAFVESALTRISDKVVLSLGWTTGGDPAGVYTREMVQSMHEVVSRLCVDGGVCVQFAVRATSVVDSMQALVPLLDASEQFGMTLWWSAFCLRPGELQRMRSLLHAWRERVFYDVCIEQ
ncbi:hypothetical protein CcCBS67573_g08440 [Chytriomyces confervae]|uniref:Menorin-like domain-containing protein n=1 Tax=Chytriomyces confervae TaxID=246404 RepID=A0A507EJP0_9FUNG|nr:hypothetical protein CcCBS67573_g08440 [Chytriomyces confervae]